MTFIENSITSTPANSELKSCKFKTLVITFISVNFQIANRGEIISVDFQASHCVYFVSIISA